MGLLRIGGHDRLRRLLSSYMDGQVTSAESVRVERHLAGCRECMAELENLRATVGLLRALPELAIPCSFTLDAVPAPALAPCRFGWATGMAATAAAVLLIALIAGDLTGLLRQTGQVMRVQGAVISEAPVVVAAAAAAPVEVAVELESETAPAAAAMAAPAPKAPDGEVVKEVSTEDAATLEKDAAPPMAAMAAPAPDEAVVIEKEVIKEVTTEDVSDLEKDAAPAIAAMAAPTAEPAATALTPGEGAVARKVEREVAVEEAPATAAPAAAAMPSRELAPEPTPQPQAKSLAAAAPSPASQSDDGTADVPVAAETAVQELAGVVAGDAAIADSGTVISQSSAPSAEGGVSLPLLELELASGALLALLVLLFWWLAVRRRRAL